MHSPKSFLGGRTVLGEDVSIPAKKFEKICKKIH